MHTIQHKFEINAKFEFTTNAKVKSGEDQLANVIVLKFQMNYAKKHHIFKLQRVSKRQPTHFKRKCSMLRHRGSHYYIVLKIPMSLWQMGA